LVAVRLLQVLFATVLLSGCTFFFDWQDQADLEPDSRQQKVIFDRIQQVTQSMKDITDSEVSNVGPNEAQSGPEKWTVCSRGRSANELRYFTFFLKGETVANWRPAVINDRCETRTYFAFGRAH
jgi:hypothetical protein